MSFLLDPPALVAVGEQIGRRAGSDRRRRAAEAVTLGVFVGTSVALYRNDGWTRPLWRLARARSGRDWMLNSGVTDFDDERPSEATHRVAALIFATYPLWLRWGVRRGRRRASEHRRPSSRTT